jgi:hypothetical protein
MAWGREDFEWERFSHLMAVVFNSNIWDSTKTKPKHPRDFNPLRQGETGSEPASDVNDQSYEIVEKEASRQDGKQGEH